MREQEPASGGGAKNPFYVAISKCDDWAAFLVKPGPEGWCNAIELTLDDIENAEDFIPERAVENTH